MKIIYYLTFIYLIIKIAKSEDCIIGGLKATTCNNLTQQYYFDQGTYTTTEILNIPFGAQLYFSGDVVFTRPVNFNCQPTLKKESSRFVYEIDCLQVFSNKTITYNAQEIYCSVDFSTIFDIDTYVDHPVDMVESYSRFMKPTNGFGVSAVFEPIIYSRIKAQAGYKCDFNPGYRTSHRIQDKYALHSKCAWAKALFPPGDFNIRITPCNLQNNSESVRKLEEIGFDKNFYVEKLDFTPTDGLFYNGKRESIYIRYYPNFEKRFDLSSIQDIFDSYLYIINYCEDNPNKFEISFGMQSDLWDHRSFNLTDYKVVANFNGTFEGNATRNQINVFILIVISAIISLIL